MGWIDSLGGLPETIAVLVIFTLCVIWIIKAIMKRVVDPMAKSNADTAATIKQAIDTNTEAVKKSMDHNEKIIGNHLSGQAARDELFLSEMRSVADAVEKSNSRRRAGDDLD
jgi:hypothetical protein